MQISYIASKYHMNFIFAKLFEDYQKKKNASAEISIMYYIGIIYFFTLFAVGLPISEIINKLYYYNRLHYNQIYLATTIFGSLVLVTYIAYIRYVKKRLIYSLVDKYKNNRINVGLLYLIVALWPVMLLVLGATLTVVLKGGTILNYHFDGVI